MTKDILLEIGVEEIPAKFMPAALTQLAELATSKLTEQRIAFEKIRTLGTPRRLTLVVCGVSSQQADKHSENKGPSLKIAFDQAGNPTKAAQGFARGQGIDVSALTIRDGYVYAVVEEQGRLVKELLPELLTDIIASLTFPKNMRWGDLDMRFARPIRWLVALFGSEVIPFTVAEITAGNITYGHRFLSTGQIAVTSVESYLSQLAANFVIVDPEERRQIIASQVESMAVSQGGSASIDEDLLEEVLYLVEYPTALCGNFDDDYLALPPEAIITPMREHQRYFPVFSKDGKLMAKFITVRNGSAEHIDIVRHGNERVLKARLADARFFYEEDKKVNLADRTEKLKTIVFQEGLGTLYDKTQRVEKLAEKIARATECREDVLAVVNRAAQLAKADLVTGMVCEFTELQGIMGREYAKLSGESDAVAEAIYEHYLPRFAGDVLPVTRAGQAVSIADKLDNIVATFSRGLIPTGSQDPFALRRQALGIVHILIKGEYKLTLSELFSYAMELLGVTEEEKRAKLNNELHDFFRLRLKNILTDEKVRYDHIDAVMAVGTDNVYDLWLRAQALTEAGGTEAMQQTVQAFTRAGNLAKHAVTIDIDPEIFVHEAEMELFNAYSSAYQQIEQFCASQDYQGVLRAMSHLAQPIDTFFGAVMVMAEDQAVRDNRLALLKAITASGNRICDVNKIIGM